VKKLLVTGTGGFIFSNFVRRLFFRKAPYQVASIDRIREGAALKDVYSNKNHQFYIGDVADPHFVDVIFEVERPDVVIHGAAETHVDDSIADASPFIRSNLQGTQVIIDACRKWETELLVYISTDEVYGHLETEDAPSWAEDATLNPRNPYAASKAGAELLVRAAHETYGLPYLITRSCNNYGPRQSADKLLPKVIKNVLGSEPVPIYGKGAQVRDWLHVRDNCDAILLLLEKGERNGIYNISAGQELSNLEVVQRVCSALGKGHDLMTFVKDRLGHDFRYSVDSSRLRALGWAPEFKLTDGLAQTAGWYTSNQWFLDRY